MSTIRQQVVEGCVSSGTRSRLGALFQRPLPPAHLVGQARLLDWASRAPGKRRSHRPAWVAGSEPSRRWFWGWAVEGSQNGDASMQDFASFLNVCCAPVSGITQRT